MKKPNFFIVGHPKTGTSALYNFLKQHPDVFLPEIKEPRFFCKDFHKEEEEFYKKSKLKKTTKYTIKNKKDYLELFKDTKEEKAVGEVSPGYLESREAAKEISKFNPNAKIIMILREPSEYLFSSFNQKQKSEEGASTFKEALNLEKVRKKRDYRKVRAPPVSQLLYSERIRYEAQVKRYLDNFPKENILVLIHEEFKNNNLETCRKIFRFLGVDDSFKPETRTVNKGKSIKFKKLKSFLDRPFMINFRRSLKEFLPKKAIRLLLNLYNKTMFKKGKDKLDPKLKKKLKKKFKPEVEKINKLLNKKGLIDKNLVRFWDYEEVE